MRYYFMDKEIYFQNKKMPDRKVELFSVEVSEHYATGYDENGNLYEIDIDELIIEEE